MNLLDESWIPVRRADGKQDWIAPHQMTEPDIVALDARRPDFNCALIQFLIGLVQTTTPMDSHVEWQQWNTTPPTAETLKKWFEPVRDAFVFDGDGARFMQDFSLRTEGIKNDEFNDIGALLIDAPGDNTLKENKDFFVKRGSVSSMCKCCAATALFTLQTNATSGGGGGDGFLTSVRGGGPLTTLILPNESTVLWKLVWINIQARTHFLNANGNAEKKDIYYIFPWLKKNESVRPLITPIQVHPAHIFWCMPRQIRFDFSKTLSGFCSICGRFFDDLLVQYFTLTGGLDYKGGWRHSLSPYSQKNEGEFYPVHLKDDGIGYKHWLCWLLGLQNLNKKTQPATIITYVLESRRLQNQQCRLWAFGYETNKAKARCWYESILPLYNLSERNVDGRNLVQREVTNWIVAADQASFLLRDAVKSAWFPRKPDGKLDARGDFGFLDALFWSQTEPDFYKKLQFLIEQARDEESEPVLKPLREGWREILIKVSERLFDADLIGVAPIERQNPRRVAQAYNRLRMSLRGDKLKEILKLPVEKKEKKSKKPAKGAA